VTIRELPYQEWHRLDGTDLGPMTDQLPPAHTRILVVEDAGEIIGHVGVLSFLHAEGWWTHPEHRGKAAVLRLLRAGLADLVIAMGSQAVLAGAVDANVAQMLRKMGAEEMPGQTFCLPVGRYTTH